jgi:hypothetical protein
MLASLFGKVTTSLGKTYVYAGLLPAGAFFFFLALYYTGLTTFLRIFNSLLTGTDAWKSVASFAAAWMLLGFVLYGARGVFFSAFQFIPTGWLGRRLIFRLVKKRDRLVRARDELTWRITAVQWLREPRLNLARDKVGAFPTWILRPDPAVAIRVSGAGREKLHDLDYSAGDSLNLSVAASDAIENGLWALYRVARDTNHPALIERLIAEEIDGWRRTTATPGAKRVLELVFQDLTRRHSKAFSRCKTFAGNAYTLPSELGNRIAALGSYAQSRYRIDTATLWDRLWWILPKDAKSEVGDARLALEVLINLTVVLVAAAFLLPVLETANCGAAFSFWTADPSCNGTRVAGFMGAALLLAWAVYRGASFAMEILASNMTALIDVYCLPMLRQLGFNPKTVGEELSMLAGLKTLFVQAHALPPEWAIGSASETDKPDDEKSGKKRPKRSEARDEEADDEDDEETPRSADDKDEAKPEA